MRWRRVLRASFLIYGALVLLLVLAAIVHAQVKKETSGIHWFPGRLRVGPTTFGQLDAIQGGHEPGTWVWCSDCTPTTPPGPGGAGANCFHDSVEWVCLNASGGGGDMCTGATSCLPGQVQIGLNPDCTAICGPQPPASACTNPTGIPVPLRAIDDLTTDPCGENWLPFCDPRNYGAVGNNIADDTAAIQAAINACETLANPDHTNCGVGGIVYLGSLQSVTSAPLRSCGVSFLGNGARIRETASLGICDGTFCSPPFYTPILAMKGTGTVPIWVDGVRFLGPGFGALMGDHSVNTADGIHNEGGVFQLRNVNIGNVEVGVYGGPSYADQLEISGAYAAIADFGGGVWHNVFLAGQRYASLWLSNGNVSVQDLSWNSGSIGASPYYIRQEGTGSQTTSFLRHVDIKQVQTLPYGNAGIFSVNYPAAAGHHAGGTVDGMRWWATTGPFIFQQNLAYKIASVPIDRAFRFGLTRDVQVDFALDQTTCYVEWLDGGLTFQGGWTDEVAGDGGVTWGPMTPCQIQDGFPSYMQVCSNDAGQCIRPIRTAVISGSGILVGSVEENFFVSAGSPTNIITLLNHNGVMPVGRRVRLMFQDGNITLEDNNLGGSPPLELDGGVNFTPTAGCTSDFVYDGFRWREVNRLCPSTPTTTTVATTTTTTSTVSTTTATTVSTTTATTVSTTTSTTVPGATTTTTATTTTSTTTTTTTTTTSSTTTTTLLLVQCTLLTSGQDVNQTTFTTASITPNANHLLLAFTVGRHTGGASAFPTVAGDGCVSWDLLSPDGTCCQGESPDSRRVATYHCMTASPTTGTLSITYADVQTEGYWAIVDCANVDTSGPNGIGAIVQSSGQGGSATGGVTWSFGSVPAANSAMIASWVVPGVTIGPGAGWTELAEELANTTLEIEWKNTGDQSVPATWTGTQGYVSLGQEIKHQ